MYHFRQTRNKLYQRIIQPKSADPDTKRQEFILTILLVCMMTVAAVALVASIVTYIVNQNRIGLGPVYTTGIFLTLVGACYKLQRSGHVKVVSYVLIGLILLAATNLAVGYGFTLPQVLLEYSLAIVIAGILRGASAGLLTTAVVLVTMVGLAIAQTSGSLRVDSSWQSRSPLIIDAIGFALVFVIIGLTSWLSNREIDHSLRRAHRSEAALLVERDNLEAKVGERTRALEQLQLLRIMELERFAAFGKMSATLVHEMSSPLMAATLDLQQVKSAGDDVKRVNASLRQVERRLQAARLQMRGGNGPTTFLVFDELRQVVEIIAPAAHLAQVKLGLPRQSKLHLYGDSVKFTQIFSNLLLNAVESYGPADNSKKRIVRIKMSQSGTGVMITVQDQGSGITVADQARIFEPFFSNKRDLAQQGGMGIGLSIVKQFVEHDFNGSVSLESSSEGTRFTVVLYSIETTIQPSVARSGD